MNFKIRTPIWSYKAVGLDEAKLTENNTVEILHTDKNGVRTYPHKYTITKEEALTKPIMQIKGHNLRVIPIFAMGIEK